MFGESLRRGFWQPLWQGRFGNSEPAFAARYRRALVATKRVHACGGGYARIVSISLDHCACRHGVSRRRGERGGLAVAETSPDIDAVCRIPFEKLKDPKTGGFFPLSAALNENGKISEKLRQRYIVADLSSTDEDGNCRGVKEYFTAVDELSEFPRLRAIAAARKADVASLAKESVETLLASEATPGYSAGLALELEDLQNYLQQVDRYKTNPVVKPAVVNGYCVGQSLSFCELVDGKPKLVYSFVTSSSKWTPTALPVLRAHQLYQLAELEFGSQVHSGRRPPR